MTRVVFMGTPEFAVPSLETLDDAHHVAGVVTQPDRRAGRGRKLTAPPVKEAALAQGLPVIQPRSLRAPEAMAQLAEWQPDVIAVAAFGQILHKEALALPPHGCLNVHASLLPKYRGAAPVSAAILDGEAVTGVTVMLMDEGLDTGPILAQARQPIAADDTTASLTEKLADLGAELLAETLPGWLAGQVQARPQDDAQATYCRQLTKADGQLDWTQPAGALDRQVRACHPWPGTYTFWRGQRLKVQRVEPRPDALAEGEPGRVVETDSGIGVVTGEGLLELVEVQPAGKRAMPAEAFARGQRDLVGGRLGR